jgi:xylulokinase
MAVGLVERADISKWNPVATTITAQPNATYDRAYGLFRRLYEQTKDIAQELT